jgi:hypothetical protein
MTVSGAAAQQTVPVGDEHDIPGLSVMVSARVVMLRGTVQSVWPRNKAVERADPAAVAESGQGLQQFQRAVDEYAVLHQEVKGHLSPPESSRDMREFQQAVEALTAGIRRMREGARMGDIFTADATSLIFRDRIRHVLAAHGDVMLYLAPEVDDAFEETEEPVINGTFSWHNAAPTPLCFLVVLPELPNFLQYRFVGRDLVLVDIDADLIVDVLPRALPFTPTRDVLYASLWSPK